MTWQSSLLDSMQDPSAAGKALAPTGPHWSPQALTSPSRLRLISQAVCYEIVWHGLSVPRGLHPVTALHPLARRHVGHCRALAELPNSQT